MIMFMFFAVYGCIGAADFKKKAYLKFKVEPEKLRIVEHKSKNMAFFNPSQKFEGEVITETIPLNSVDLASVNSCFRRARESKKKEKVTYTLEDKQFTAAIKYKDDNYFVKVKEAVNKK